jgi:release factor glutamine methyltransferase
MTHATAFFQDTWIFVWTGVYEPADDTFLLCKHLEIQPGESMLELGTGSGLVSIVAAKAGAQVVATDQSSLAVQNAKQNVILHKLQNQIEVRQGYLFDPLIPKETFSLIVFNPPYLPGSIQDLDYDPAWTSGTDGRLVTDMFLIQCAQFLEDRGRVLLIQSSLSNPKKTYQILKDQFQKVRVKAQKRFFFEELFLFEAINPRQT